MSEGPYAALPFAIALLEMGDNGDVSHVNAIGALVVKALARGETVPQTVMDALLRGECCTPELQAIEAALEAR